MVFYPVTTNEETSDDLVTDFEHADFKFPLKGMEGGLVVARFSERCGSEKESEIAIRVLESLLRIEFTESEIQNVSNTTNDLYFLIMNKPTDFLWRIAKVTDYMKQKWNWNAPIELVYEFDHFEQLLVPGVLARLTSQSESQNELINLVKQYIYAHLSDGLTRDQIADMVFMSPAYFSRYFKEHTGESFHSYVQRVRMERAMDLLDSPMLIKDLF